MSGAPGGRAATTICEFASAVRRRRFSRLAGAGAPLFNAAPYDALSAAPVTAPDATKRKLRWLRRRTNVSLLIL